MENRRSHRDLVRVALVNAPTEHRVTPYKVIDGFLVLILPAHSLPAPTPPHDSPWELASPAEGNSRAPRC